MRSREAWCAPREVFRGFAVGKMCVAAAGNIPFRVFSAEYFPCGPFLDFMARILLKNNEKVKSHVFFKYSGNLYRRALLAV